MTSTRTASALVDTLRMATVYDLEQPRTAGSPTFAAHQPGFVAC